MLRKAGYVGAFGLFLASVSFTQPSPAAAQCQLCAQPSGGTTTRDMPSVPEKPLRIEIVTHLDFSRLALLDRAGGEVSIDPSSGHRQMNGGITDLGGLSLNGEGRLEGEPGRLVRVMLPERIILSAPNGSTAELVKLETNLPAQTRLDRSGRLNFSFGGKLKVRGNADGQYRGRITITADYE